MQPQVMDTLPWKLGQLATGTIYEKQNAWPNYALQFAALAPLHPSLTSPSQIRWAAVAVQIADDALLKMMTPT